MSFFQIKQAAFPMSYNAPVFAFQFSDRYSCDGWQVYDPVKELKRQGLPNESWKISPINDRYEISDTYPRFLGVPKMVSDDDIRETAKFRSRGRFPVLSWMHPDSLATITRLEDCKSDVETLDLYATFSDARNPWSVWEATDPVLTKSMSKPSWMPMPSRIGYSSWMPDPK